MRLKSLYIKDYKNIHEQTFDFSSNDGYIALIGLNGSGKSNLLEAVGLIFDSILNGHRASFEYKIEYENDGKSYLRTRTESKIDGRNVEDDDMVYPSSVIACYSGEDLRLWHEVFEDYYMHYFKNAIDNNIMTPRFMYINKYCWDIAFISIFCSKNESVKQFLKNCFNIENLDDIEVVFEFSKEKNFKEHEALKWIKRIRKECLNRKGRASLTSFLSYDMKLIPGQSKEFTIFHYLYLLTQPKKNENNPIDKYITKIKIENKGVSTSSFSEGHKKLILIECITKILGDERSFLLLDEPDAHVHIALKKEMLNTVFQFKGQTILTTHSPIVTNEIYNKNKECLLFLDNGTYVEPNFVNNLIKLSAGELDFINGSILLSSKKILVTEGPYDKRYLEKAIDVLKKSNSQYDKFDQIVIISSGSADNSETFYEQVLKPQISRYDKIVFLFDYDKAGYDGCGKIKGLKNSKVETLFYQDNYAELLSQEPAGINKTIMVEDLFNPEAYKIKIEKVKLDQKKTHKDFRCFTEKMDSVIKSYIKSKYFDFKDEYYEGFKPVLDKLLEVFALT